MNQDLKFETLIHLYFGEIIDIKINSIRRAYRDFSRTLEYGSESKAERLSKKIEIEKLLETELSKLLKKNFKNQDEFDKFHRELSKKIKTSWHKLTYGQIQKWINMTLKYWIIAGENRVPGIDRNYKLFHIPIDRVVKERIFFENSSKNPWSKIKTYANYFSYQLQLREKINTQIPIDFEAAIFINKTTI